MDSFSDFERAARGAVVAVDVCKLGALPFRNYRVRQFKLCRSRVCDISCDPVVVVRNFKHIADDGVNDGLLMFQFAGEVIISQADREFVVRAGDLAVLAADRPYRIVYRRPSRRLFMCVPNERLKTIISNSSPPPVVRELYKTPIGRVAYSIIMSMANEASHLDEEESRLVEDSLLNTLSAFSRRADRGSSAGASPRRMRDVEAIFDFMERNFTDATLTPLRIAQANNVSLRQLHVLVSATGTTVARRLWERRLQACYEALQSPQCLGESISQIAYANGFNDSAHFSRAFRNRFGIAPRQLRAVR